MAANEIILELLEGGVLRFPGPMLKKYDLKKGTRIKIIPKTGHMFWLEAERPGPAGKAGEIAMSGDLAMFGISDMLSLINMGQKSGSLTLESKGVRKTAYFKSGDVVFAASNEPEDRLGNVLYKTGKITKEKLAEAETKITKDVRFGTVLIQNNYVTPKDLWWAVKYQVEEIVYSIFAIKEGFFYFVEGEQVDEDLMRFSLNTQNILMEGFRRLDEMGLIRAKIPNLEVVLRARPQALATKKVSPAVEKVLQFIDGKNNVRDVIRLSGVGEFNIFKLFYELLKMGLVEVAGDAEPAQAGAMGDPIEKLVDEYNKIYGYIYQNLKQRNINIDVREAFNAFFSSVSPNLRQLFSKVTLSDDGLVNKAVLMKNFKEVNMLKGGGMLSKIAGLGDLMTGQILNEGLNELLNFELFTAKNTLQKDEADSLILKVREAQAQIHKSAEGK